MPKKNTRNYFTQETEDAIVKYNNIEDKKLKDHLYKEYIEFSLFKMTQSIIHTYKFYYALLDDGVDDVINEVISFVITKLDKFDPTKKGKAGKPVRAYSYFQTVIKRYLILKNQKSYKYTQSNGIIDTKVEEMFTENNLSDNEGNRGGFDNAFIKYVNYNFDKMFYNYDIKVKRVGGCLLTLLNSNKDNIVSFKKAIYLYLREMSGENTNTITKTIKILKSHYISTYNEWYEHGYIKSSNIYE